MENYRKIKIVGRGNFGCAVLVQSTINRKSYIMKVIDIMRLDSRQRQDALNEVVVLKELSHPFIITYRESFLDKDRYLCIVMDYCEGGDLYTQIIEQRKKNTEGFSEDQILSWFVQICLGLKSIHDRRILHRDLKTQNIFLTAENTIKIGDFGIAKVLQNTCEMAKTAIGTPYYLSPEICKQKPYNQKTDIWSLGCILYELATLKHAFDAKHQSALMIKILKGTYPQIPNRYSSDLSELIAEMLQKSPDQRPSIKKILEKPFLKETVNRIIEQSFSLANSQQAQIARNSQNKDNAEIIQSESIQQLKLSQPNNNTKSPTSQRILRQKEQNNNTNNNGSSGSSNTSTERSSTELKKPQNHNNNADIKAQNIQRSSSNSIGVGSTNSNSNTLPSSNPIVPPVKLPLKDQQQQNQQQQQQLQLNSLPMAQHPSQLRFQLQQHIIRQSQLQSQQSSVILNPQQNPQQQQFSQLPLKPTRLQHNAQSRVVSQIQLITQQNQQQPQPNQQSLYSYQEQEQYLQQQQQPQRSSPLPPPMNNPSNPRKRIFSLNGIVPTATTTSATNQAISNGLLPKPSLSRSPSPILSPFPNNIQESHPNRQFNRYQRSQSPPPAPIAPQQQFPNKHSQSVFEQELEPSFLSDHPQQQQQQQFLRQIKQQQQQQHQLNQQTNQIIPQAVIPPKLERQISRGSLKAPLLRASPQFIPHMSPNTFKSSLLQPSQQQQQQQQMQLQYQYQQQQRVTPRQSQETTPAKRPLQKSSQLTSKLRSYSTQSSSQQSQESQYVSPYTDKKLQMSQQQQSQQSQNSQYSSSNNNTRNSQQNSHFRSFSADSDEYFEEPEDQRVKCEFLGIDGQLIPGVGDQKDSICNRIEALKVYLEKNLGEDLFIATYNALSSLEDDDLNESDQLRRVKSLMKDDQQKFIPLIFQMICCEDSFFS